jgi:uncharacterized protein (DUF488 family)
MPRRLPPLATIGYAEQTPESLVALLQQHTIEVLADVRESARSRRPGFSKTALANAVQAAGIEYVQFRELGVTKPGRDAYHRTGDFAALSKVYAERLKAAPEALAELIDLSREHRVCLLCLEADASQCHRSLLAARVTRTTGARVVGL